MLCSFYAAIPIFIIGPTYSLCMTLRYCSQSAGTTGSSDSSHRPSTKWESEANGVLYGNV